MADRESDGAAGGEQTRRGCGVLEPAEYVEPSIPDDDEPDAREQPHREEPPVRSCAGELPAPDAADHEREHGQSDGDAVVDAIDNPADGDARHDGDAEHHTDQRAHRGGVDPHVGHDTRRDARGDYLERAGENTDREETDGDAEVVCDPWLLPGRTFHRCVSLSVRT